MKEPGRRRVSIIGQSSNETMFEQKRRELALMSEFYSETRSFDQVGFMKYQIEKYLK
ncbi:MAG: hypothetical protein HOJ79_02150 [Nitrospina sp.]|jgi:hypothetical protein|nr:hypothetical protein [Nitrospina sp.]